MSQEAIDILENEINILKRLSSNIVKKKSALQKRCVDQIKQIEKEINELLSRAGVLSEHAALVQKKRDLNKSLDNALADIDHKVEQANNIAIYLNSRIEAFKFELQKEGEEG